ncbi:PorP/SprF family type IX secretion system membrane protein [Sediminitomix flava]|nr:type IX secretion system membrane protein PorP/SprF [Sediminitomix flava]
MKLTYASSLLLTLFIVCLARSNCEAQDPQYTQFYAAPLYLNPAMTGSSLDARMNFNYRNQWTRLPSNYESYLFGFDHHFIGSGLSLGLMLKHDNLGQDAPLSNTQLSISTAYLLRISKSWSLNLGIQGGIVQSDLDFNNFLFGDQLDNFGPTGQPTQEPNLDERKFYPDISLGGLLLHEKMWFGFSAHHVNSPETSFTGGSQTLPIKYSVMAGYVIPFSHKTKYGGENLDNKILTPVILYQSQGKSDQLSLGIYGLYSPVMLGVWYRGLPVLKENGEGLNQDALAFLVGFKLKSVKVGYSYDVNLSDLPQQLAQTHEVSLSFDFNFNKDYPKKRRKRKGKVICPTPIPWL